MYFEIFKQGILIKRGRDILGGIKFSNELMYVPTTTIKLPVWYRGYLNGHDEMKIFVNGKVFWGIIKKVKEDKDDETVTVYLDHVVSEWEYREISVNNAIKDQNINVVFKGSKTKRVGDVSVSASDFTIFLDELGAFTVEQYVLRAGATAWTADGNRLSMEVDTSQIENEAGEYDVTFSSQGVSVTVEATVKENPDASENDYYILSASNFSLPADNINLTAEEYIERAHAVVTRTELGEAMDLPIPPIEVDRSSVRARDGAYSVTFTSKYIDPVTFEEKEMSVSVTCVVAGDNFADPTIADNIADIYADYNFAYPGWRLNYEHGAGDETVDYVYSRQNKLDAMTKTMELTKDLFWRVRFVDERVMDISPFGDEKDLILSKKPSGPKNVRIIEDPEITHEYDHVINCATVYSEKSDTGVSSLTLREIYDNPELQEEGFPVVVIRANVNNERDYHKYTAQFPVLAPNNWLEYAVIDEESVALESGTLIESTYAFNDIAPFAQEVEEIDDQTHEIADEDRIKAAKQAYDAAIRRLKQNRRRYEIKFPLEEMPAWIAPGDKVRFIYDNGLYILADCSVYQKMVLEYDDFFYVTKIDYDIDDLGAEVDTVVLEKEIRVYDRDVIEYD